ncbi:hypothetical protein ABK040_000985 [Willaertia magna]
MSTNGSIDHCFEEQPSTKRRKVKNTTVCSCKCLERSRQVMESVTLEELQQLFDIKLEDACDTIGISTTSMKKLCRKFGIPRWPYRKLQSLQLKKERVVKEMNETKNNLEKDQLQEDLLQLEADILRVRYPTMQVKKQETREFSKLKVNNTSPNGTNVCNTLINENSIILISEDYNDNDNNNSIKNNNSNDNIHNTLMNENNDEEITDQKLPSFSALIKSIGL